MCQKLPPEHISMGLDQRLEHLVLKHNAVFWQAIRVNKEANVVYRIKYQRQWNGPLYKSGIVAVRINVYGREKGV